MEGDILWERKENIEKNERGVKKEPEGIAVRERQVKRISVQFEIG